MEQAACALPGRPRAVQVKALIAMPTTQLESHAEKPKGFPGGLDGKESACNAGDPGSIPGSGRSPREGNDNPLQYSCLGNPMDGGAW